PNPPPSVSTDQAAGVAADTATLRATINPNGLATTSHFDVGPTTAYGTSTPDQAAGSDRAAHAATATVGGLAAGTTYHYRVVAISSAGTTVGSDLTLTTANPPMIPVTPSSS